eukprot:Gb_12447 [translate_table: standard]
MNAVTVSSALRFSPVVSLVFLLEHRAFLRDAPFLDVLLNFFTEVLCLSPTMRIFHLTPHLSPTKFARFHNTSAKSPKTLDEAICARCRPVNGIGNAKAHSSIQKKLFSSPKEPYMLEVLLTDLANDWSAKHTWSLEKLLKRYGEVAFNISQSNAKKVTMKLKDYVSYMTLQHDEDPLYIFDPKFGEVAPGLLEDYKVPHLFQEDLFDVLDNSQRPPFRWLVLGPARSGASWHVDPALTSAWNTLLQGRKRIQ